jgi:phage-related protein
VKPVAFLGTSLNDLRGFPACAAGSGATNWIGCSEGSTRMIGSQSSIGAGVWEIRVRAHTGAFRVIYVAIFADVVYVIHAFQKKTRETAKQDVDLTASRLREQMARMR